jgi:choloylglycine hydrolase
MYNSNIRCINLGAIDFNKVAYHAQPLDKVLSQPVEMIDVK